MKKIRLIRTTIIEFIPNPEHYPDEYTIEQMAELECDQDDRELLFSGDHLSDEVKYEIVEENNCSHCGKPVFQGMNLVEVEGKRYHLNCYYEDHLLIG